MKWGKSDPGEPRGRADLAGPPAEAMTPRPLAAAVPSGRASWLDGRVSPLAAAGWIVGSLVALAAIEALFSSTALITAIDPRLLNGFRMFGLLCGAVLAFVVVPRSKGGAFAKAATAIFLPVMVAFGFGSIAWRVANWWEFAGSNARWERAEYPILRFDYGRKGRRDTVEIDPFQVGDRTEIPLPDAQYREASRRAGKQCVIVAQRRSPSGAVQIRTKGEFALSVEALEIGPCRGVNPWR